MIVDVEAGCESEENGSNSNSQDMLEHNVMHDIYIGVYVEENKSGPESTLLATGSGDNCEGQILDSGVTVKPCSQLTRQFYFIYCSPFQYCTWHYYGSIVTLYIIDELL